MNVSYHFAVNDKQSIQDIRNCFNNLVEKHEHLDCKHSNNILHCFLPSSLVIKKKLPYDVHFFFQSIETSHSICFYGATGLGLEKDRDAMLNVVKESNGVCVFLGKIEGGVKKEYDMAKAKGCTIIEEANNVHTFKYDEEWTQDEQN